MTEKINRDEAMAFMMEGGGAPAEPVLRKTTMDGSVSKMHPSQIVTALNEAMTKLGIDPNDRSVNEIVTTTASGLKGIGY